MSSRPKSSEAEILEKSRIGLDNAEAQPEIEASMAELGYDAAKIAEGKGVLATTWKVYDANKTEDDETSAAYADFSTKKKQLGDTFKRHRKKAKVVFRKDPLTAEKLAITDALPRTYMKWMVTVKKFYSDAAVDPVIQDKLLRLKVTRKELNAAKAMIKGLETARSKYLKEKGESENATQLKDAAFAKLDDWMIDFYAVAAIGLEDKPQLLEALGKKVRS